MGSPNERARVSVRLVARANKPSEAMLKNDIGLYTAFKAKDARFDGRFFCWYIFNRNLLLPGTAPAYYADRNLRPVPLSRMPHLCWRKRRRRCRKIESPAILSRSPWDTARLISGTTCITCTGAVMLLSIFGIRFIRRFLHDLLNRLFIANRLNQIGF